MRLTVINLSLNAHHVQSQNSPSFQLRTSEPRTYYWARRRFAAWPKSMLGSQRKHVGSNFKFPYRQVGYQSKLNFMYVSRLTRHSNLATRVFPYASMSLSNIVIQLGAPKWNSLVLWYMWVLHTNLTLGKLLLNLIYSQNYLLTTTRKPSKIFQPRNESLLTLTSTLLI